MFSSHAQQTHPEAGATASAWLLAPLAPRCEAVTAVTHPAPARGPPRCWWWSCCSLPSCGYPTERWCCSAPLWPSPFLTRGCPSLLSHLCVCQQCHPPPSFTASCPRSSRRPSGGQQCGAKGTTEARGRPQHCQLQCGPRDPPAGADLVGARSLALRQLRPHSHSRWPQIQHGLRAAPSPVQPSRLSSVCSPAGSCLHGWQGQEMGRRSLPMAP